MKTRARIEPRLLRQMTVKRVVDVLLAHGPSSRAELVRQTGISAPTISKAVSSLLDAGLVEEGDAPAPASVGRPGRLLALASRTARIAGVVLDADRVRVVAAGLDGQLIEGSTATASAPAAYDALLDTVADLLRPLLDDDATALGVGISTPGLTDRPRQEVVLSPNLPATDGRSPARDLAARLGLPCWLVQESHALCLAERMQGAARGQDDFAMLDASAGLGLGVVQNGELLLGQRGFAGELGHVTVEPDGLPCGCGNRGCLETRATDAALVRDASARLGRRLTLDDVTTILRDDPATLRAELDRTATWLSVAVAAAINLFNPAAVYIHASWPKARPELFADVVRAARARALPPSAATCRIEPARATKLHGAVAGGLHRLFDAQTN